MVVELHQVWSATDEVTPCSFPLEEGFYVFNYLSKQSYFLPYPKVPDTDIVSVLTFLVPSPNPINYR